MQIASVCWMALVLCPSPFDGLATSRYTSSKHTVLGSIPVNKKYHVQLSAAERQQLDTLIRTGAAPARTQTHARILLKADCAAEGEAWPDDVIAQACDVS